jgi:outer membrane murein-binding lipoprotein Lpp
VGTPRDTQGGASALRLARCEQALAQVSSDADAVRSEAVNTRTGVDALALVVEQFVARIESLEADVATVASQQLAAG